MYVYNRLLGSTHKVRTQSPNNNKKEHFQHEMFFFLKVVICLQAFQEWEIRQVICIVLIV